MWSYGWKGYLYVRMKQDDGAIVAYQIDKYRISISIVSQYINPALSGDRWTIGGRKERLRHFLAADFYLLSFRSGSYTIEMRDSAN